LGIVDRDRTGLLGRDELGLRGLSAVPARAQGKTRGGNRYRDSREP